MVARLVAILHEKVNFDDNLSGQGSPRAVRDPVLGAALAGWAGKLLIACAAPLACRSRDRSSGTNGTGSCSATSDR